MRKISLLEAAALIAAFLVEPSPTFAQSGGYRLYPWCAIVSVKGGEATNYYFSTLAQRRAELDIDLPTAVDVAIRDLEEIEALWLPRIPSNRIRAVRQNQRIIAFSEI
jgi:hypothetical protein